METEPPNTETKIADPTSDHGSSGKPFGNLFSISPDFTPHALAPENADR